MRGEYQRSVRLGTWIDHPLRAVRNLADAALSELSRALDWFSARGAKIVASASAAGVPQGCARNGSLMEQLEYRSAGLSGLSDDTVRDAARLRKLPSNLIFL
jgi:hypothetical protein